jgi:hypothetical protein
MTKHSLGPGQLLLLAFILGSAPASQTAAAGEPATGPAGVENPDYAKWARLKEGAWVRVRILSTNRMSEWTSRLAKVTPDEVVLEVAEAKPGEAPGRPWEDRVPARLKHPPAGPAQSGDEDVPVADQTVACRWETRTSHKAGEVGDSGETVWASPLLPGFVKRVSWLAADKDIGLPATKALEMLVAYDLPPRDGASAPTTKRAATRPATTPTTAPPGTQQLPTKAGPPVKFAWTYRFDPPGRRDWSRTDAGHWEERWETGQVVKFEITRWIADGDVRGAVVRRLPDRDLETVIPDAGKDAPLYFRHLRVGMWTLLGNLEESTAGK